MPTSLADIGEMKEMKVVSQHPKEKGPAGIKQEEELEQLLFRLNYFFTAPCTLRNEKLLGGLCRNTKWLQQQSTRVSNPGPKSSFCLQYLTSICVVLWSPSWVSVCIIYSGSGLCRCMSVD